MVEDLDDLLFKAQNSLAEQKALLISIETPKVSPLSTLKLDSGFDKERLYISGTKRGPVKLHAPTTTEARQAELEKDIEKAKKKESNVVIPGLDLTLKEKRALKVETAGPNWFNLPAPDMTDEVKKDLHILRSRGVLDPKRHYKKETLGESKFFQMGTVIEGPTEFYSSRLVRKDRRNHIVEELLADQESRSYFKKKYSEIQDKKSKFTKRRGKFAMPSRRKNR